MKNRETQSEIKSRNASNLDARIEIPVIKTVSHDFQSVTADRKSLLYVVRPLRIIEVQGLVEGTTPSAVFNLQYSEDTTGFTDLFNSDQTINSVTTTQYFYPDQVQVPQRFWLWLEVASVGGTVDHLHIGITYEQ